VSRGDIIWADLGAEFGRRPVCVISRDAAIEVLNSLTCAPVTRTIRSIRSEVELGELEGVLDACVVNCDTLLSIPKDSVDTVPLGRLGVIKRRELDQALRYSLDIQS